MLLDITLNDNTQKPIPIGAKCCRQTIKQRYRALEKNSDYSMKGNYLCQNFAMEKYSEESELNRKKKIRVQNDTKTCLIPTLLHCF